VSETTRFAMPEITIGLFPDVGGTWMLSRLPGGVGRFLALTGAQLGAADCLFLGVADHAMESSRWSEFIGAVRAASWQDEPDVNAVALDRLLNERAMAINETGPLQRHYAEIRQACDGHSFESVCEGLAGFATHTDPWMQKGAATFQAGSPGSARLSFTLLDRARLLSLADVFRQEYVASLHCGVQGDLQVGIRALLIDKDRNPRWNPATLQEASPAWVERFFEPPWPLGDRHPLEDLGSWSGALRAEHKLEQKQETDNESHSLYRPWQHGQPDGAEPTEGGARTDGVRSVGHRAAYVGGCRRNRCGLGGAVRGQRRGRHLHVAGQPPCRRAVSGRRRPAATHRAGHARHRVQHDRAGIGSQRGCRC